MEFRTPYIRSLRQRRFSAVRTAVASALIGAGVVAFIVTRNLLGIGTAPDNTGSGGGTGQQ